MTSEAILAADFEGDWTKAPWIWNTRSLLGVWEVWTSHVPSNLKHHQRTLIWQHALRAGSSRLRRPVITVLAVVKWYHFEALTGHADLQVFLFSRSSRTVKFVGSIRMVAFIVHSRIRHLTFLYSKYAIKEFPFKMQHNKNYVLRCKNAIKIRSQSTPV